MPARRTKIQRKLMVALMVTSGVVALLTSIVFIAYDVISSRAVMVRSLTTRAQILAANTTAALAFQNVKDAKELLSGLERDPHMVAACLYDSKGRVLAAYPDDAPQDAFPSAPERQAYRFEKSHFVLFQPVVQEGRWLGTLYLKSDLLEIGEQFRLHALVALLIMVSSFLVALALSVWLQRRISQPILALADTARIVAKHKDYSVRSVAHSDDELGLLTGCFNEMLDQIQQRDISLSKSEAGLRAVLESALDSIITIDHEGRIVEFNPAAEEMFGYTREQAVGAEAAGLIMPLSLRARHREGMARHLATGRTSVLGTRVETTGLRADGSEFPVELAVTRIAQTDPPKFTGFIRDITHRRLAEEEIRRLNEELEQRVIERTTQLEASNKELEAFSYSVSHDLRAPLRGIDGFSQALLDDCGDQLNEEGRDHLRRVRAGCQRMGGLIDDMLALARVTRREMQPGTVDLSRLASGIAEDLRRAQPDRKVSFIIHDDVVGFGDAALLRIALENLLGNAWKFTGPCAEARIEFGALQGDKGEAVYFIRDNGAGFDMRHQNKLFGAFQRLHSQKDFEGSGIGLATVSRIVHRHGGRIWAESDVGQGATFFFSLREDPSCDQKQFSLSRTTPTTRP